VPRLARMEELLDTHRGGLDLQLASTVLADRAGVGGRELPRGHHSAINADIATHSVIIDATARTLWVSRYPNLAGGYVAYQLDEAFAGEITPSEVIPAQDLRGTLRMHQARRLMRDAREHTGFDAQMLATEALAYAPGHPTAMLLLAEALVDQAKYDEARAMLTAVLAVPPAYADQVQTAEDLLEDLP
jgi:hypothetical protein